MANGKDTSMHLDSGHGSLSHIHPSVGQDEQTSTEAPSSTPIPVPRQLPVSADRVLPEPSSGDVESRGGDNSTAAQSNTESNMKVSESDLSLDMTFHPISDSPIFPNEVRRGTPSTSDAPPDVRPRARKDTSTVRENVSSDQNSTTAVDGNRQASFQVGGSTAAMPDSRSLETFDGRRETFSDSGKLTDELCEAGFYQSYQNTRSFECYNCGVVLSGRLLDMPEFDAWTMHAKLSENCQFVRKTKGVKFVENVNNPRSKKDLTNFKDDINNDYDSRSNKSPVPKHSDGTTDKTTDPAQNAMDVGQSVSGNGHHSDTQPAGVDNPKSLTLETSDQQQNISDEQDTASIVRNQQREISELKQDLARLTTVVQQHVSEHARKHDEHSLHLDNLDNRREQSDVQMRELGDEIENNGLVNCQNATELEKVKVETNAHGQQLGRQETRVAALGNGLANVNGRVDNVQDQHQELATRVDGLTPNLVADTQNVPEQGAVDPVIAAADVNETDVEVENTEPVQVTNC